MPRRRSTTARSVMPESARSSTSSTRPASSPFGIVMYFAMSSRPWIVPCVERQAVPLADRGRGFLPAREGVVDRPAGLDVVGVERQDVAAPAAQLVADAHLDFLEAVQHVELGDAQARDAVDDDGALERGRV